MPDKPRRKSSAGWAEPMPFRERLGGLVLAVGLGAIFGALIMFTAPMLMAWGPSHRAVAERERIDREITRQWDTTHLRVAGGAVVGGLLLGGVDLFRNWRRKR